MSGPKCYSYEVDPAVLARQQETLRLAEEVRQVEAQQARLVARHAAAVDALGERVTLRLQLTSPVASQESIDEARAQLRSAEAVLEREVSEGTFAALTAGLQIEPPAIDAENASGSGAERALDRLAARDQGDPEMLAAAAARVAARLPVGVDAETRAEVHRMASLVGEAGPLAEVALESLRVTVDDADRLLQLRREREAAVEAALLELSTVGLPGVSDVRRRLHEALLGAGALPRPLQRDVDALLAADRDMRAREHVARTLANSFKDLGYEVGEEFATALATDGIADVVTPWDGYRIRVREPEGTASFRVNVVRGPGVVPPGQDVAVETAICEAYCVVTDDLDVAGVATHRTLASPPGALPVQIDVSLPPVLVPRTSPATGRDWGAGPKERER